MGGVGQRRGEEGTAVMSEVSAPYRSYAARLLSMDLLDPVRDVMVGDQAYSALLKESLRSGDDDRIWGYGSGHRKPFLLGDVFGRIPLASFIDFWWWRSDRRHMGAVDEMTGLFFPVGHLDDKFEEYVQHSLGIESLSEELSKLRNLTHDSMMLGAVRTCEASFLTQDPTDWDAHIINEGTFPNPSLDITFPIYKGYLDLTEFIGIKSLLRRRIMSEGDFRQWLAQLEHQVGPLQHKKEWKL